MNAIRSKSTHVKASAAEERWLLYDASEHNLGRMATRIAMNLMGKDRPTWTPSELTGAHVVVVNSRLARVSGRKGEQKSYAHYTRYSGGIKDVSMEELRERRPNDIVALAVRRMLPKTRLGHDMLRRLKVYPGADHPHSAQKPEKVEASRR
ncbi:MAG TPA: 50S ribosomal protein L13 [Planctomycetota bacterium]|jgi:large subunit ribosomal protein L13|nr:50S ribosomal protein L13 [Planctomycetota bacterium]